MEPTFLEEKVISRGKGNRYTNMRSVAARDFGNSPIRLQLLKILARLR